jgi:hypothetical protein
VSNPAVQIGVFASALWVGIAGGTHRLDQTVSIRSVRVEMPDQTGVAAIVIEASGELPEPSSGRASDPPRIYLDFPDVLPLRAAAPVSPNPLLSRIRVAQHSASPLVTRLVLDLSQETTYRIDVSARTEGRIVVLVRAQSPASPASRAPGASADMQYTLRVSATLVRLHALRPLLEAIDHRTDKLPGNLDAALKEFDDLAKLLTTVKSPPSRTSTHALLLRTCTLGERAVRLRQGAVGQDAASSWEAASAAAGALLMLERATTDLKR